MESLTTAQSARVFSVINLTLADEVVIAFLEQVTL